MVTAVFKSIRRARTLGVAVVAWLALAGTACAWTPEAATYGVGELKNQQITMSDGTVLSANVYYPTNSSTGQEASGSFPVILTQTPYGKDDADAGGSSSSSLAELAGESDYLIARGY